MAVVYMPQGGSVNKKQVEGIIKEIVNLEDYAKTSDVPTKLSELTNDKDFATVNRVLEEIAKKQLEGSEVDLSAYATLESPDFIGDISLGRKADTTIGVRSVALGENVEASGTNSHAEGVNTIASGYASHAENCLAKASGHYSHAEGVNTIASGTNSHAEGDTTIASGMGSHAEGSNTIASGYVSHVQGKWNIEDTADTYAHIVGNGNQGSPESGYAPIRSNAHTLDWDGNGWYKGDLYVGGTSQDNANKVLSTSDIYFDGDGNLVISINGVTKKFSPIE